MTPYRVILADKHAPLREGLRRILGEQPDLEITAEAGEGFDLLNHLRRSAEGPLMVILDSRLPNLQGAEAVWKIKAIRPGTKVLILSMQEDVEYLGQALATGAEGYLMKESASKDLLRAVETIRQGDIYVPEVLAGLTPGWSSPNPFKGR